MCEYCCNDWKKKKWLAERTEYGKGADCYIGIDVCVNENILEIEAVGEVGYPSQDSTVVNKDIEIKYCPMCGRKLNE